MNAARIFLFGILSTALFIAVAYAALRPAPAPWPQLLILFLAAVFTGAISAADVVESFKASGTGIEARTRAVVARAEGAIKELQQLAASMGEFIIGEAAGSQYMGSMSASTRDAQMEKLLNVLKNIGVDKKTILNVRAASVPWDRLAYENRVLKGLPERTDAETNQRWSAALSWNTIEDRPEPDDLENLVREFGTMTPERTELLADLRYLLKNKKHRRPDFWTARDEWMT